MGVERMLRRGPTLEHLGEALVLLQQRQHLGDRVPAAARDSRHPRGLCRKLEVRSELSEQALGATDLSACCSKGPGQPLEPSRAAAA
jgi:hypothetical protein